MIKSFANPETEKLWQGNRSRSFPPDIQRRALIKLQLIDAAVELSFLRLPPETVLNLCAATAADSKAFGLTINGAYVLSGTAPTPSKLKSPTIIKKTLMTKKVSLIHPGIILREEFFGPLGITQLAVTKATGIPQSRLSQILAGQRSITADTAARLGRFFKIDPRNWLNLQIAYDLREIERTHGKELARVQPSKQVA